MPSAIESPRAQGKVYADCISVSGWFDLEERDPRNCRVSGWIGHTLIGETEILTTLASSAGKCSFNLLGRIDDPPAGSDHASLRLTLSCAGATPHSLGEVEIQLIPSSLGKRPYGEVVFSSNEQLLHRENIYGSGPPVETAGGETVQLIRAYLPLNGSVIDVGCGAGAYGPPLQQAGYDWLGLEVDPNCLSILQRRKLPHRPVLSAEFPCADKEWDAAICIEVLEHIRDPDFFLAEIVRVTRARALFSVPNLEVLPYFHSVSAVPWHLLEADHKNFFTRASLRALLLRHFTSAEVFSYARHPLLSGDGVPMHLHLFAVADI